jgi:hypothetical protein
MKKLTNNNWADNLTKKEILHLFYNRIYSLRSNEIV